MLRMIIVLGICLVSGVLLSGCGGGASYEPKVVVRPAEDAAQVESNGGTTPKATGDGGMPGTITGRIVIDGTVPTLAPILKSADIKPDQTVACKFDDIKNDRFRVGNNGLRDVFIYLDKTPKGVTAPPMSDTERIFDQKGCFFLEHAFICRVGQTILVKNSDPIAHNTHPLSKQSAPNLNIPPMSQLPLVYNKSERTPFLVKCDVHAWMQCYHLVLDHPWAAVTDAEGRFQIPEIPGGTYSFRIWHSLQDGKFLDSGKKITVDGNTDAGEISFDISKFKLQ